MLKVVVISLYYTVKSANLIRAAGFTDSKKKRLPAEQTPAPEEPEKSEVQKIHAQDKPETVNNTIIHSTPVHHLTSGEDILTH